MWGARNLVAAASLVMVAAGAAAADVTVYRDSGQGSCGDDLMKLRSESETVCAIACSKESRCSAFSYKKVPPAKYCQLHQTFSQSDGAADTTCYLPRTQEDVAAEATTQQTREGTATETPPPPPSTTTATTSPPPSTTTTATTSPPPSTTTSTPSLPPLTTTTEATTTTTTTTTEPWESVAARSVAESKVVNINEKKCDGAAIGIFQEEDSYSLICDDDQNIYVVYPQGKCSTPGTEILCMDTQCAPGSLITGFRQGTNSLWGPCGNVSAATIGTVLDNNDCHTVSGPLQTDETRPSWSQWRICGGTADNVYVMKGMKVTQHEEGVWMDSITCCRLIHVDFNSLKGK